MSKRKTQPREDTLEKKLHRTLQSIDAAIEGQCGLSKEFIRKLIVEPIARDHPFTEIREFKADDIGWQLKIAVDQQIFLLSCSSMPCVRVTPIDSQLVSPIFSDYNPILMIDGPGLVGIETGQYDQILTKVKGALRIVKADVLAKVYKLILEARFHRMHACPIRGSLIYDDHLTEDEWPEIPKLTNEDRGPLQGVAKWGTPQTDQELLEKAIQARNEEYALEMRRLEYSKIIEDLLKPYSADWSFKVGYKLRQSVATSHNYHCQESPLYYDTWKEFKEAWARRLTPMVPPDIPPTPGFEQEYIKRKPDLDQMGKDLETKLQAELTSYRRSDK